MYNLLDPCDVFIKQQVLKYISSVLLYGLCAHILYDPTMNQVIIVVPTEDRYRVAGNP